MMLTRDSGPLPRQHAGWQYFIGIADAINARTDSPAASQNAYHLKLGAMAALSQNHPCDMNIAGIPAQIAATTRAGAVIAQFVMAASILTGTTQTTQSPAAIAQTLSRRYIDAGVQGLKILSGQQQAPTALYPQRAAILNVISQIVPACPEAVRREISIALRGAPLKAGAPSHNLK